MGARAPKVRSVTLDTKARIGTYVPPPANGRKMTAPQSDARPQFANWRSRTARHRSTSLAYASPAPSPSPLRRASIPSATSAAE